MESLVVADTEMECIEPVLADEVKAMNVNGSESNVVAVSSVDVNDESEKLVDRATESPTAGEGSASAWAGVRCVYCNQLLAPADEPKLLECLHSACNSCVKAKIAEQNQPADVAHAKGLPVITCAACRIVCRQTQIIDNQFVLELSTDESNSDTSKSEDLKCNSCADNETATSWCVECAEFICNKCVQAHKRLKITKDHTIKLKEEAGAGVGADSPNGNLPISKSLICAVHQNEQLTLFCENCDVLTCRDCQLTDHRDHKYKFTHEIAAETKTYISGMLKDVSYKRVLLDSAMKVIDDRQNLISEKKQTLVKEITNMVVKLTNTINIRGKELVHRLTEVCDTKQRTLQEKRVALKQLSQLTDSCIEFVGLALERGSDTALLYTKRHLTSHLQRIKCRRADIPNPEIPVRIHLALDKVPDLVKVLASIGAIVVDGKVYPPAVASPVAATSPSAPPHSPLIMPARMPPPYPQVQQQQVQQQQQQAVIQMRGGVLGRGGGAPAPLLRGPVVQRQQQVSSSTHPPPQHHHHTQQQQQQQHNPQLRGLLQPHQQQQQLPPQPQPQPQPVYVQTAPGVYQAVQPAYVHPHQRFVHHQQQQQQQQQQHYQQQQAQNRLATNRPVLQRPNMQQFLAQGYSPHHQQQQQQHLQQLQAVASAAAASASAAAASSSAAKWHIPQHVEGVAVAGGGGGGGVGYRGAATLPQLQAPPPADDSFKITLKQMPPATVTSTIPKTPSPSLGKADETERNLDKFCQDSVNDLMATIAKLDSNGVQVLAEGKTGGSPHVDSSTDEGGGGGGGNSKAGSGGGGGNGNADTDKDDPNEDWCAVCMDGGELVCCDKCPKVFHQGCHVPPLTVEESDTWQCLLCMNFADIPEHALGERRDAGLSAREQKIAERLVLELYCQYEPSLHFRELVAPDNDHYHSIVKRPISLDQIKQKLNWTGADHYTAMEHLVKDIRLLFRNAYLYNPENSAVYRDGKRLEAFFDQQLEKWLPAYAYENCDELDEDDATSNPPNRKYRRILAD